MAVRLPPPLRPFWAQAKRAYSVATRSAAPVTGQLSRIRGGYLPRRAVRTMEESVAEAGGRVWIARHEERVSRAVPPGDPPRNPTFVDQAEETVPRVAVAELPLGRVLGPHRVVIDRRGAMIDEVSRYWGATGLRDHPVFWHPFPEAPTDVAGTLGVLAGRGDLSYYHFLLDILPRLEAVERSGAPAPDRWYAPRQRGFQRQVLELAGILDEAEIIDSDLVTHVRAERLLVPGFPDTDLKTPAWAVAFVRDRLLPPGLGPVPGRGIYVTRGNQRHNRIVVNEAEVVEMLGERGFTVVDPGVMPVHEQITAFAEAEWIVGPHGGALGNLAFASPGASVVELFAPDYVQGCYWKLADCVPGLSYRYLVGAGRPPRGGLMHGVMSDISVNVERLATILDDLPAGAPRRTANLRG
jgi:hypothetical protein